MQHGNVDRRPSWVKTGKARSEQMSSAVHPRTALETDRFVFCKRDTKGSNMRNLNKRLDGLEAKLAPVGRPFVIWANYRRAVND